MKTMASLPFDKLYWMRIGFGALAGFVAYAVFGIDYTNGVLVGVIFYLGTYYLARYLWFKAAAKQYLGKMYSTGIGGYVLVFLFVYILLFTISTA